MSAWLLSPGKNSKYHWFQVDDAGKDAFLDRWASKPREFAYEVSPLDEIQLDGGGAVHKDEPRVSWAAAGILFSTYLRQLPFVLAVLKLAKENEKVPGCVAFAGAFHTYILGFATRDQAVLDAGRILAARDREARRLERRHAEVLSGHPHVTYMGLCACQSGRPFSECCGQEVR
jgi:hypothetical protein